MASARDASETAPSAVTFATEDGLDALTRAMVQLPTYIERLLGGGRDIALVLLPMLNDLRAARGEPLLSEGTLLLLNLSPSQAATKAEKREGTGEDPVAVATRLRPKFQLALLGWIKGGEGQRHLETLSSVSRKLEAAATRGNKLTHGEFEAEATWSTRKFVPFVMQRISVATQIAAASEIRQALGMGMAAAAAA